MPQENWRYPVVPEERIDKKAVKFVSEKLKISELWVRRMHDHQWDMCLEAMQQGKTVYVPGMFRILKRVDSVKGEIDKFENKLEHLKQSRQKLLDKITKEKAKRSGDQKKITNFRNRANSMATEMNDLIAKIDLHKSDLVNKSSAAYKPTRKKRHEENNKKTKQRKVRYIKPKS